MSLSLKAVEEFNALGVTTPYEKEFIRKDGTRWWGLFAASRLRDDEGVEYVIDISERKGAEKELRRAREDLELRVMERTSELEAVNGALRDEIIDRQRTERVREELLRQVVTAQEEERRRISRELHDQVGQLLTALMLGLKSIQPGDAHMAETLKQLQGVTETVGREVHDMALRLRPTALDDLGLLRTLSNYIDEWSQRARIEVDFHSSGWDGHRLPPHIETTIYRIVQEALTNVVKHANATRVSLILDRRADQAVVIIEDNGTGFDSSGANKPGASKRLGLIGMKERAALVAGELSIESTPEGGTTLFVRIPLPPGKPALPS
jgi:signal transduction histidine kinase